MFNRHSRDGMRLDWQAPCAVATDIFARTAAVAQGQSACQCGLCEETCLEVGGSENYRQQAAWIRPFPMAQLAIHGVQMFQTRAPSCVWFMMGPGDMGIPQLLFPVRARALTGLALVISAKPLIHQ